MSRKGTNSSKDNMDDSTNITLSKKSQTCKNRYFVMLFI